MLKEGFYFWRSRKPQELFEGLPASIGMITSPAKWSSRGSVRSCCWLAVRQHEEPKAHRITTARGSGSHITPDSHSGRAPRLQESSCLESWRGFLQCTHCLQDGSIRPRLAVRILGLPHFNSRDLLWLKNQLFPFRIEHHNTGRFHAVVDEDVRFAVNIDAHSAKGLKGNRLERLPVNSL